MQEASLESESNQTVELKLSGFDPPFQVWISSPCVRRVCRSLSCRLPAEASSAPCRPEGRGPQCRVQSNAMACPIVRSQKTRTRRSAVCLLPGRSISPSGPHSLLFRRIGTHGLCDTVTHCRRLPCAIHRLRWLSRRLELQVHSRGAAVRRRAAVCRSLRRTQLLPLH